MNSNGETQVCDACRTIPLTHLGLDVDEPIGGWAASSALRDVPIVLDDLGRPAVAREVLGQLIAEHRQREARLAEERAEKATAGGPIARGVPAQEGSTPFESMMLAPGYQTARDEFDDGRVSPTQEFMDAQFAEARKREADARAGLEAVKHAQRVLEGRDG
jgi:hypothetical protein